MTKCLKSILLRFMELFLIFLSITKKKMQANNIWCEYILLRIDVYFIEYFLAVEIDEKRHADRDLIFEKKNR